MASSAFYQAFVEIVPEAKNLRKTLAKEFDSAGPEAGRNAGKGVNAGVLGAVGKLAGPLAVAFAGIGIGNIIGNSISSAANLQQSVGAIDAVFKGSAKQMHDWAGAAATDVGLTQNEFNELGTLIGSQLKNGGTAMDDLAPKTNNLITLGADLSSMFGGTTADAVGALSSALKGERDPIEKYGVSLNQAKIDAEAAALGFEKVGGSLSAEANQAATLSLIMKQTADAHGNFASESDTLAHKQQVLNALWSDGKAQIGTALLPAVSAFTGVLITALGPALDIAVSGITNVITAASGLWSIFARGDFPGAENFFGLTEDSGVVDFLFDIRDAFGVIVGVVGTVAAAFQGLPPTMALGSLTEPVTTFGVLLRSVFDGIGPILATLGAAFAPLIPQLLDLWSAFSPLSLIFQAIGPLIPQLAAAFGGLAMALGGALGTALTAIMPAITSLSGTFVTLIGGLITTLLPIIVELVGILGPVLGAVITALVPVFDQLIGVVMQVVAAIIPLLAPILGLIAPIGELIGALLPPLIQLFVAILTPIIGLVSAIIGLLLPAIQFIITILAAVIGAIVKAITWFVKLVTGAGTAGEDLMDFFAGLPGMIGDALGDIGSWLVNAGSDLIQGFIDGIEDMIGNVGDAIGGVMDFVGGFFPHSPAKRGPFSGSGWRAVTTAGLAIGDEFAGGLLSSQSNIQSAMTGLLSGVSVPNISTQVDAGLAGSVSASSADRPILMDGALIGWMRDVANGEARIVLNMSNNSRELNMLRGRQA